jgi:photosystem II stability/assembly factor-like uncharacterized protein
MKVFSTFIFLLLLFANNISAQWIPLNTNSNRQFVASSLPSGNVGYFLSSSGPLIRTIDGGATFDSLFDATLSGYMFDNNDVCFVNDSIGFISTHNSTGFMKIFKTINMGNSWTDISPFGNLYGNLQIHFLNPQRGYISSNSSFDDSLWVTDDGGVSWSHPVLGFTLGSGTPSVPAMHFVNDSTGYLVGGDGTFAYQGVIAWTDDYGQTWTTITLPSSYTLLVAIHFANKDTGYAVSRYGGVFRTVNEGMSWDSIATFNLPTYSSIFFINGKVGYLASGNEIYKTTDAGQSWTLDYTDTVDLFSICFFDSLIGYVTGDNGRILKRGSGNVIIGDEMINEKFNLFPNPFSDELYIKSNTNQEIEILIYNSFGKIIKKIKCCGELQLISMNNLSAGIYFYQLLSENRTIKSGRVVKADKGVN